MTQKNKTKGKGVVEENLRLEQMKRRLDNLDARLDSIDSMVTVVAERIVKRPLSVTITCPHCGKIIEIGLVGNEKMMR